MTISALLDEGSRVMARHVILECIPKAKADVIERIIDGLLPIILGRGRSASTTQHVIGRGQAEMIDYLKENGSWHRSSRWVIGNLQQTHKIIEGLVARGYATFDRSGVCKLTEHGRSVNPANTRVFTTKPRIRPTSGPYTNRGRMPVDRQDIVVRPPVRRWDEVAARAEAAKVKKPSPPAKAKRRK